MKKVLAVFLLSVIFSVFSFGQQKYAVVIGNNEYRYSLNSAVKDANDIGELLQELGFKVDRVLNGSKDQIENAVDRLRGNLEASKESCGFFFYSGHGVEVDGKNYLLPANTDSKIKWTTDLPNLAVSLDAILKKLGGAKNKVNIIVLDTCRDNPFAINDRGIFVVNNPRPTEPIVTPNPDDPKPIVVIRPPKPPDEPPPGPIIIMYATSANTKAIENRQNGIFTSKLLKNLKYYKSVYEIFNQTMGDVEVEEAGQRPEYRQWGQVDAHKIYIGGGESEGGGEGGGGEAEKHFRNGEAAFKNGDLGKALQEYGRAINIKPDYADAHRGQGLVYQKLGNPGEAIRKFNDAIRFAPNDAKLYDDRGLAHFMNRNFDGAIQDFERAIKLDPKKPAFYYNLGNCYKAKGDAGKANEYLTKARELGF